MYGLFVSVLYAIEANHRGLVAACLEHAGRENACFSETKFFI